MQTKIIVFDLYNTLVETVRNEHFFLQLYKMSDNGFGLNLLDYTHLVMKNDIQKLLTILPNDFKLLYDANKHNLEKEIASVQLFEETLPVLKELKKRYPIYLISNLASPYKKPLYNLEIDSYFTKTIFSSDCGLLKPEKEIFRIVEAETGCSKTEIVMIGDSQKSDIVGAKALGWNYLKVNRKRKELKEYEIASLLEIKERVQ